MEIEKVLVVEDELMFREFLENWLGREGFMVAGAVGTLKEATELCSGEEIDLILLDMDLPDGEGLEFVEAQMQRRPTSRILVLTAHLENYPVLRLKRSGVMGVLDKGETSGHELRRAFEAVDSWRTYYSDRVERTFRSLVREAGAFYKTLSPREEEIMKYFGRGLSNDTIARELGLSVATIQGHRRNVMAKVGVKCTPELIMWAIRNGFVLRTQLVREGEQP